ncbi:hypothetical protein [Rhodocyclus gracilis]|uniref:Uncharacterized protein n=1 Tax=Rhodocyclus tenuis TaxID=1066 RepID=A0A6L5JVK2_RHOTE|nr:hypothetical protein [Rhodocyclus gracilis]MQY50842.1 hypothetical protein [Rhodocyclus gracilis]
MKEQLRSVREKIEEAQSRIPQDSGWDLIKLALGELEELESRLDAAAAKNEEELTA